MKADEAVAAARAESEQKLVDALAGAGEAAAAAKAEWEQKMTDAEAAAKAESERKLAEAAAEFDRRLTESLAAARADAARDANEAAAAAKAEWERKLADALAVARAESERKAVEAAAASIAEAQREASEAAAAAKAEWEQKLADALADLREESDRKLTAAVAAAVLTAHAEVTATFEQRLQEAAEAAETAAPKAAEVAEAFIQERQTELATMDRLLEAMRAIDEATALTEVLDRLTAAVQREAGRAALLLVRQPRLRGWRAAGFEPPLDPTTIDLPADDGGLVGRAVAARTRATTAGDQDASAAQSAPPPFAALPPDHVGFAIPLEVGGQIVAVLYADDATGDKRPNVPSAWPEAIEFLVRHAARSIEALTLKRAHGLQATHSPVAGAGAGADGARARADSPFSRSVGIPSAMPAPAPARPGSRDLPVEHDDEAAQRYARLLVSEIKLYYEPSVTEGRRCGDLLERLKPEIARARRLYEERIPASVRARREYFDQELVRTLANGDPRLLGQVT